MEKPKILKLKEDGEYLDYLDEMQDDLSLNSQYRELDNIIEQNISNNNGF